MKYTVADIDHMRFIVRQLVRPQGNTIVYGCHDWDKKAEEQLRTYMMNGTTPRELEKIWKKK